MFKAFLMTAAVALVCLTPAALFVIGAPAVVVTLAGVSLASYLALADAGDDDDEDGDAE